MDCDARAGWASSGAALSGRACTRPGCLVTIHKVLGRHELDVVPTRKRGRPKPKRYNRPVPGDRVQLDSCQIRPGRWPFTAIDHCSRCLLAALAHRRSAAAALAFVDRVLAAMPFAIQRVQTERGTAFGAEQGPRRRMAEAIRVRPVRPPSPQLNARLSALRTRREEVWAELVKGPPAQPVEYQRSG